MRSWYATWDSSSPPMSNLSATAPPFTVASPSLPSHDPAQNMGSGDPLRFTAISFLNSTVSPNPTVSVPDWLSIPVVPECDIVNYAGENPCPAYPYGDFSGGSRNVKDVGIYYPQQYFPELGSDKPLNFSNYPSYDGLPTSQGITASGSAYNDKNNSFSSLSSALHVSDVCSQATNRGWLESTPFWSALNSEADGLVHRSYERQGAHSFEDFDASTEASNNVNILNRGYYGISASNEPVNMNLFPRNNTEALIDSPPSALSGSTYVLPHQANSSAPPLDFCSAPKNYQMDYSNLVDKCSGEHFSGQGNGYSVIDTVLPSVRSPVAVKVSERNFLLDATQHNSGQGEKSMGIQRYHFGNGDYLKNEKVVSGDASDRLSTMVSKLEIPSMVVDGLNVAHESNHAFSSSENVSESVSHYGHTVDSPCWKGASIKRFGSSKACEILGADHVSGYKDLNSLISQISQISQISAENDDCELNLFPQRQSELTTQDKNLISGKNQVIPVEQTEVHHSPAVGFGDVQEVGPFYLRPSYSCRNQGSEDVNASWKRNASIDKLSGDVSVKYSKVKQNSYGHDLTSKEKQPSLLGGSDVDRKINDAIDVGLSDVSMRCVEHVLCSPPSTIVASAKQGYFHGEELTPRMDVPLLVKTILNFSELLLLHNSNSDLRQQDYEVLKKATNNLEACLLKDDKLVSGSRETSSPVQDSPLVHGESLQCQKNQNEEPEQQVGSSRCIDDQKRPASVNAAAENIQSSLDGMPEKDGSSPYSKLSQTGMVEGTQFSNQKNQTDSPCSSEKDSVLPVHPEDDSSNNWTHHGRPNFLKQDKITQDIKRILVENFHDEVGSEPQTHLFKNLWLEAEAALCSVNYMARYNHAKLHMVNSKPENEEDENGRPILTNLCNDDKSNQQRSTDATDDVLDRFHILKARASETDCITTDNDEVEHQSPKSSNTSPLQSSVPHPDNIPCSSVMERFSILNKRLEDTNSTQSDGLATQPSDILERSVLARLSILKQRDDIASSMNWNLAALEANHLESAEIQGYISENLDTGDGSTFSGYSLLAQTADCSVVDGSSSLDGAALEWEHVQRDEVNVQNP